MFAVYDETYQEHYVDSIVHFLQYLQFNGILLTIKISLSFM